MRGVWTRCLPALLFEPRDARCELENQLYQKMRNGRCERLVKYSADSLVRITHTKKRSLENLVLWPLPPVYNNRNIEETNLKILRSHSLGLVRGSSQSGPRYMAQRVTCKSIHGMHWRILFRLFFF